MFVEIFILIANFYIFTDWTHEDQKFAFVYERFVSIIMEEAKYTNNAGILIIFR
jgi:hypothetical protein